MASKVKFFADLGLQTALNTQIDGDLTVAGDLTVTGTTVTVNSSTTSVEDSMLELANSNTSADIIDIGIYGNYNDGLSDGGVSEYTGLFRDATDSTWKLFEGLEVEPSTSVNTSGSGYTLADLQVGDLTATTITATNSLTGASMTYPTSDGTNGQVLTTNGSGTLSFQDATGGLDSGSITTTSTSITNLDTFTKTVSRGGKYIVSLSDSTSGVYQTTEIHLIHDGSSSSMSQFGTVLQGGTSELATFSTDISGSSVRLRVTPASTNSTVIKFKKILIDV
tara:strand:- start:2845 stop:3681 length:837 start_codon:yes stop_codon:yes gene_type:complete